MRNGSVCGEAVPLTVTRKMCSCSDLLTESDQKLPQTKPSSHAANGLDCVTVPSLSAAMFVTLPQSYDERHEIKQQAPVVANH